MALLLTGRAVESLVTMAEAIDAVESAFRALAAGLVEMPQRAVVRLENRRATHLSMPAALTGLPGALAVKLVTTFPANAARGLPVVQGLVLVHDPETGSVLGVIDAGYLTALRTGAASGVATRHLSRPESRVVGVIGAGVQAELQLAAMCAVRPIDTCRVFDVDGARAKAFATRAAARFGLAVEAAPSARQAIEDADVVVVATSSPTPVLEGRWLEAGQHVNAIGTHTPVTREIDSDAVVRARVVPDLREACLIEAGDLLIPIREGVVTANHVEPGLAHVVAGLAPGRRRTDEITLFKSVGLALEDVAVATLAYRTAIARGIGTPFDFAGE